MKPSGLAFIKWILAGEKTREDETGLVNVAVIASSSFASVRIMSITPLPGDLLFVALTLPALIVTDRGGDCGYAPSEAVRIVDAVIRVRFVGVGGDSTTTDGKSEINGAFVHAAAAVGNTSDDSRTCCC